jgi:hypothetical protein
MGGTDTRRKERRKKKSRKGTYLGGTDEEMFYEGELDNNGGKEGRGKITYRNGMVYDGEWKNNKKDGKGILTNAIGATYIGDFKADRLEGKGVFKSEDGEYKGEWKKDMKHGKGVFTFADGKIYDGDFKKDMFDGNGIFTYANGNTFNGEFKNDTVNGKGVYTSADGADTYEGEWENGLPIWVSDKICEGDTDHYKFKKIPAGRGFLSRTDLYEENGVFKKRCYDVSNLLKLKNNMGPFKKPLTEIDLRRIYGYSEHLNSFNNNHFLPWKFSDEEDSSASTGFTKRSSASFKNNASSINSASSKNSASSINSASSNSSTKKNSAYSTDSASSKSSTRKRRSGTVIRNFVADKYSKRRAKFLSSICSDSGVCISFGTEIDKINMFFNRYKDFKYAVDFGRIGKQSANGFITEIKYEREKYVAYTVLKSSVAKNTDNLMYEYEVGQFINKQNKRFPCFIETYGLFRYEKEAGYENLRGKDIIENLKPIKFDYSTGCLHSQYIAVLIQHIKNANGFNTFIKDAKLEVNKIKKKSALNWDVPCLLYQIYFALSTLKDQFTHYDLHAGNVQLYEPVKGSYITYNYHLKSGAVVKFNSKYIAKIIDYGRSYYNDDSRNNSSKTYDTLCKKYPRDCGAHCGIFPLFPPEYFLTPQRRNVSSDLRLLDIIKRNISSVRDLESTFELFLISVSFKEDYGTPENETDDGNPLGMINNVQGALLKLNHLISDPSITQYQDAYSKGLDKLGDLHIYEDNRPMKFQPPIVMSATPPSPPPPPKLKTFPIFDFLV